MKTYLVIRLLQTHLGAGAIHPVKSFEREEDAKAAKIQLDDQFRALLEAKVVVKTPESPMGRAIMTVGQLLAEFGIAGYAHNILGNETHSSLILTPEPRIIQ